MLKEKKKQKNFLTLFLNFECSFNRGKSYDYLISNGLRRIPDGILNYEIWAGIDNKYKVNFFCPYSLCIQQFRKLKLKKYLELMEYPK